MGYIDDTLHHFINALGIKSNSQLDDEERNKSSYLRGGPSAFPGGDVQLPAINMVPNAPMGPPTADVIADRFPQEALLNTLARAETDNRVWDKPPQLMPSFEAGKTRDEDLYFSGQSGHGMTPQEVTEYIDFISPHQFDDMADMPAPAIAAMRRRR